MNTTICITDKYISYKSLTIFLQISQIKVLVEIVRNVRNLLDGNILNHRMLRKSSYNLTFFYPLRHFFQIIIKN